MESVPGAPPAPPEPPMPAAQATPPSPLGKADAAVLRAAEGKGLASRTPFAWGLAEATFFVIVPDVAIGYAALYGWRRGLRAVAWAIAGAVLGGVLVFAAPGFWGRVIPHLPGISAALVAAAAQRFHDDGWWAVVTAPTVGHPYKVYALLAAQDGWPLWELVLVTPAARGWRFLAVALLCAAIGAVLRRPLRRRPAAMLDVYLAFWALQYTLYFRYIAATY